MTPRLLEWLHVSEQPDPPPGAGANLVTFRASRRHLLYSVLAWIPKQLAAVFGLLVSLVFLGGLGQEWLDLEAYRRFMETVEGISFPIGTMWIRLGTLLPIFEGLAIVLFFVQLVWSGLLLKLSWELCWYMVGDESLRLRSGVWSVREQTMTIANIQNLIIRQNPLQRLLGIADLEVHTAGGSSGQKEERGAGSPDRHHGRFRGVDDAAGLRDRIRRRLLEQRGAGLGEAPPDATPPDASALTDAARKLAEEARALREALTGTANPA